MGNFTPNPTKKQMNRKLTSKAEKKQFDTFKKLELPTMKNKYKKPKIKNSAPNCVQKNIK